MEYEKEGTLFRGAFWSVMGVNVAKVQIDESKAVHPAGPEFHCLQLSLVSSTGEHLTLQLQPGEGRKLWERTLFALESAGDEPAKRVVEFLDQHYPRKSFDR
jgi:hypothetical protein